MAGLDSSLVGSLVAGARKVGDPTDPVVAWVRSGSGSLDGLPTATALAAIEAATRVGNGAALASAKANAREKAVRKAAGAALHRLKAAGQTVAELHSEQRWTLGAEETPLLPPVALLSIPDTEGYFSFLLVAAGGTEILAFAGLAGGGRGHQEVQHTELSRSGRRAVIEDARRDAGLVELPFTTALNVLERAFEIADHPPQGWDRLLHLLDKGTRNTARLVDPFRHQEQTPQTDALSLAVPLLDGDRPLVLVPDSQVVSSAVVEALAALHSPLEISEESRAARVEHAVDLAANEALSGRHRKTWALALEVMALLAEKSAWEDLRLPACHTALALRAGWEGKDIPYVREILDRLIKGEIERLGLRQNR